MFDIGFAELLLIAIVGLLVLGPDRLPGAVRNMSLWIGRLRRSFNALRTEIEREVGADEIRQQLHNESIMKSLENSLDATPSNDKQIGGAPAASDDATALDEPTATPDKQESRTP